MARATCNSPVMQHWIILCQAAGPRWINLRTQGVVTWILQCLLFSPPQGLEGTFQAGREAKQHWLKSLPANRSRRSKMATTGHYLTQKHYKSSLLFLTGTITVLLILQVFCSTVSVKCGRKGSLLPLFFPLHLWKTWSSENFRSYMVLPDLPLVTPTEV